MTENLLEEICPGDSVPELKQTGRIIKELNKLILKLMPSATR
jgi:hypothetical protein